MTWHQPGPGRPRGDRTGKTQVRHTRDERQSWDLAAEVEGIPVSTWIRRELNRAAGQILARLLRPKPLAPQRPVEPVSGPDE